MLERFLGFAGALRAAGVPVATSENVDALRALGHVPFEDRDAFRAALAATMVKSAAHRPAFDVLFDLYFGAGPDPRATEARDAGDPASTPEELLEELAEALRAGGGAALRDLARRAVVRLGRVDAPRGGSPYFQYRVFRVLDPDRLAARLEGELAGLGSLEREVRRRELREGARAFRRAVEAEVRRRLAEHRGPEVVAAHSVRPLPEDLELLRATREEVAELRRAIRPLARKLAARLALRRRHGRRGRLDVRRTVRRSLSTGGVPFHPVYRPRRPHRPELFLLCDVSGSVSAFARFTLMLVHALQSQFARVRSFTFVDTIDEVTRFFEREDFLDAVERMEAEARVVWLDGHSDYGTSLERFLAVYGDAVGPRATVLVLGDARNNYRSSSAGALRALRGRARRVWWLNPEPARYWDTGDSIASEYARHVDGMVEVRNLRQLEAFIARVV
jgi:uncharacterized protein with von Willebrand factor type A (vWA) domain